MNRTLFLVLLVVFTFSCKDDDQYYIRLQNEVYNEIIPQLLINVDLSKGDYVINKTVVNLTFNEKELIDDRVNNYTIYFPKRDSIYKQLLKRLIINDSVSFLLDELKIKNIKVEKNIKKLSKKKVFVLSYSKIIFDKNEKKAVFYTTLVCGGDCGEKLIVFIEKKNGYWKLVDKNTLSVS